MTAEYRIRQEGQIVAWCNSEAEAAHYAAVYSQNGAVTVEVKRLGGRWRKWLTVSGSDQ